MNMSPEVLRGLELLRRHLDEGGHDWTEGTQMQDVQAAKDWLMQTTHTQKITYNFSTKNLQKHMCTGIVTGPQSERFFTLTLETKRNAISTSTKAIWDSERLEIRTALESIFQEVEKEEARDFSGGDVVPTHFPSNAFGLCRCPRCVADGKNRK